MRFPEKAMLEPLARVGYFGAGAVLSLVLVTVQKVLLHTGFAWYGYIGPLLVGGSGGVLYRVWLRQRRVTNERYARQALIAETLRTLNSLVVEVSAQGELLQRICETLVRASRFHHAWIALFDSEQRLVAIAESGLAGTFESFSEQLAADWQPDCVQRVLAGIEPVVVTDDPANTCPCCPLAPAKPGLAGMVARLEHDGTVYGVLSVSVPGPLGHDPEETAFFREIARDVGQALYHRQLKARRRMAEEALGRSEKSLRELVDNSLVGIMLIENGEIIYQNPEQRRLFGTLPRGYRLDEFQGVHPEDLPKLAESYRQVMRGEVPQVDVDFRYYPARHREGGPGAMKWVFCRARPIDYQGKQTLLVSMMDMSHARELERLVQIQDKMSSLGRVAAGIAHEIRNPLSGVNIYLNTLEKICRKPGSEATVREIFQQLYTASGKIESVIRRVMDFSRPGQPHFANQEVNGPVDEVLRLCAVTMRKSGVTIEPELGQGLPVCRLDPHLIEQVLMNLLANSAEAMKNMTTRRLIRVRTEYADGFVLIRVADSGPGVPLGVRDKVFDPYYTTKSDGTGIGLSISHRIVADHGGRLTVSDSALGGAEFVVALPVAGEAAGK